MSDENTELKRILAMVESGKISAAEGARLLESTRPVTPPETETCPYCAERIPIRSGSCPECGSNLGAAIIPTPDSGTGLHSLTGLSRFLVVYTLLVSGFKLFSLFFSFGFHAVIGSLLSILGLVAGLMILKGKAEGWTLGILWSALQVVTVIIGYQIVNQQVLHLGINFNTNGQGLGINLIGIILLILFIKANPHRNTGGIYNGNS
jgi:hypothetical protein